MNEWRGYKVFGNYMYKGVPGTFVWVNYERGLSQLNFFSNSRGSTVMTSKKTITYTRYVRIGEGRLSETRALLTVQNMEKLGEITKIK